RETRKTQRLKDLQPSHPAKASKKMDTFVNRPLEDTSAVSGAVADEAEERVAALEGTAYTSKQRIEAIQEEMRKLMDYIDDLDNRGRRCNLKILGIPELKEGDDMILQREIPEMLGHRFPTLEIQRAHRVPTGPPRRDQREGNRPRPVMVNLLRYQIQGEENGGTFQGIKTLLNVREWISIFQSEFIQLSVIDTPPNPTIFLSDKDHW
ncbi:hypothetical protein NFI96_005439, partial [Prochilodus magdalenae]